MVRAAAVALLIVLGTTAAATHSPGEVEKCVPGVTSDICQSDGYAMVPDWLEDLLPGGAPSLGAEKPDKPSLASTLSLLVLPALLSAALAGFDTKARNAAQNTGRRLRSLVHGEEYSRGIAFKQRINSYGYRIDDDGDDRNNILQKALTLHIAALEPDLDFEGARVVLTKKVESNTKGGESDSDDEGDGDGSVGTQLKKFVVSTVPPQEQWVTIQKYPHIEYMLTVTLESAGGGGEGSSGKLTTVTTTHTMRSRAANADTVVNE